MGYCPSNCSDITLVRNPQENCEVTTRRDTPSRLIFFECNTTLPDPITNENIKPLFDSGAIVASMELAQVTFGDPTYEEIIVSDCRPPERYVATRSMTFQDLNAVTYGVSSPSEDDPYFDYDFWDDKQRNQRRLNYGVAYCSGDVRLARAADGSLLTASITAILNYQRPTAGGASTEFKQVEIVFQGDPLALTNKPEFNLIEAGIIL